MTCLSLFISRPDSHLCAAAMSAHLLIGGVFIVCVLYHTPFRNSGVSRDQFCHTLPGATVMEGAVKGTSGAASSRWDLALRGRRDFSEST